MTRTLLVALVVGALTQFSPVFAQEANTWYFGYNAGIDFNTDPPTFLTDGEVNTSEGVSAISDQNGDLLFYTDGSTVWNKNHDVMLDGDSLWGNASATQSAMIVPFPGSTTQYYVFTVPHGGGEAALWDPVTFEPINTGLAYSIVDMSLDGGNGAIIEKNTELFYPAAEQLTAIACPDGDGYWIISREFNTNHFISFKFTEDGVDPNPVNSYSGFDHLSYVGNLKPSPDGTTLAYTTGDNNTTQIMSFDPLTGEIEHQYYIPTHGSNPYGVEFSPDGTKLYIGETNGLQQYDLTAGDPTAVINSRCQLAGNVLGGGGLQMGPDGNIYWAYSVPGRYLGVVNNPNESCSDADYVHQGIDLGEDYKSSLGLPNVFPGFIHNTEIEVMFDFQPNCLGAATEFEDLSTPATDINNWHWEFGDGATSNEQNPAHTYTDSGTYIVTLSVFDGTDTIQAIDTMTISPGLDANIDPVAPMCVDQPTVNLTVDTAGGTWSGDGVIDSLAGLFDPTIAGAGEHTITYELNGECVSVEITTIEVLPLSITDSITVGQLCQSSPSVVLAEDVADISWAGPGIIDAATGEFDPSLAGAGTHTVVATAGGQCPVVDSTEITVVPDAIAEITTPDTTLCAASSTLQIEESGQVGNWAGAGVSASGLFSAGILGAGEYDIIYQTVGLCAIFDTVTITVLDNSQLSIDPIGPVCVDGAVQSLSIDPAITGSWSGAGVIDTSATFDPTAAGVGTHEITFTAEGACNLSAVVSVEVVDQFEPEIVANESFGCETLQVELSTNPNLSGIADLTFAWDIVGYGTDTSENPSVTLPVGSYEVNFNYAIDSVCFGSVTLSAPIEVSSAPSVYFEVTADPVYDINDHIKATNLSTDAESFEWTVDGQLVSSEEDLSTAATDAGWSQIVLTGTNAQGCTASHADSVQVWARPSAFFPKAFSPNGDGLNDVFQPVFSGLETGSGSLLIFNRWGEMIYEIRGANLIWDGSIQDAPYPLAWPGEYQGKTVKSDVYTYMVEFKFDSRPSTIERYTGKVTITN